MNRLYCDARPTQPLSGLLHGGTDADVALSALIDAYRFERSAGAILKLEGDPCSSVYIPVSGWLVLSKSLGDGHRQIIDVALPGEMLQPSSANAGICTMQIEAFCDVKYAAIPQNEWSRFRDDHPEIARAIDRILASTLSRMAERMLRLGRGSAESIIAFVICELCLRSTGQGLVQDKQFHIPMTQQQLGDFCGLSSVHVCRTLRRFRRNGILDVTDHMDIVVRDVDALSAIAEIDPGTLREQILPAA